MWINVCHRGCIRRLRGRPPLPCLHTSQEWGTAPSPLRGPRSPPPSPPPAQARKGRAPLSNRAWKKLPLGAVDDNVDFCHRATVTVSRVSRDGVPSVAASSHIRSSGLTCWRLSLHRFGGHHKIRLQAPRVLIQCLGLRDASGLWKRDEQYRYLHHQS